MTAEPQSYEVTTRSAADPQTVFRILADGSRWQEWARPFVPRSAWEREGTDAPGGVGAIRRLGFPPFVTREEIVEYDPPRRLAYVLRSGLPVRNYRADVELTPDSDGTIIHWRATFYPRFAGTGALFRVLLRSVVAAFGRRLATFAASRPSQ